METETVVFRSVCTTRLEIQRHKMIQRLAMKPFCSQESKIYSFREKMQNFTCLCSLVFRTLLGGAIMGILVHAAFDF